MQMYWGSMNLYQTLIFEIWEWRRILNSELRIVQGIFIYNIQCVKLMSLESWMELKLLLFTIQGVTPRI